MSTENDKLAAAEHAPDDKSADNLVRNHRMHKRESFLAGASYIRSTVVAPLEEKLAGTEFELSSSRHAQKVLISMKNGLQAQLTEAQRVIKDFREALERIGKEDSAYIFEEEIALSVLAKHPASSEEKAE